MNSNTTDNEGTTSSALPDDAVGTSKDEKLVNEHGDADNRKKLLDESEVNGTDKEVTEEGEAGDSGDADEEEERPPLPDEAIPPLPLEPLPAAQEDDGWEPVWEQSAQAFYFYNRLTGATQWDNPRVPDSSQAPGTAPSKETPKPRPAGGYDPSIHGDYDPNAWYAKQAGTEEPATPAVNPSDQYAAVGQFNRFTGRWQSADLNPENFNDEAKSKRQMNAYFDVDAAANSHDGRSLKAERSGKKLSKSELKQFKEKRKAKKEEKRRAWLRD